MSDARGEDVRRAARSANRHFSGAIDLFENEDFKGAGRNSYRAAMAFMHARHFHNLASRGYDSFDPGKAIPTVTAARVIIDRFLDEIDEFRNLLDGD